MIKPLILVVSCARDRANGRQQAVEETWMKEWGSDFVARRIILGGSVEGVFLLCFLIILVLDYSYFIAAYFVFVLS
jgi:hypothetical protein